MASPAWWSSAVTLRPSPARSTPRSDSFPLPAASALHIVRPEYAALRLRSRRHMSRLFRSTALIALLALALAPAALAQSQATTGVIEGTVFDASGAPVPGASVTIRN